MHIDHEVYMVMDYSDPPMPRFWAGHGWTFDPIKAVWINHWNNDFVEKYYRSLCYANCQVALVKVTWSHLAGRTTIHDYQVVESCRYDKQPEF